MRLTLEQHGEKYIIEADGNEQTIEDMLGYFDKLLKVATYVYDGKVSIVDE